MKADELSSIISFGYWVQRRRKALDLTRAKLAQQIGCSPVTIKKIEQDERRPSLQMAELLAQHLLIPEAEQNRFLQIARGKFITPMPSPLQDALALYPLPPHGEPSNQDEQVFVARERELKELEVTLNTVRNGQGQIRFITGGAGRGKTMLVKEFARRAQTDGPDLLVVTGYCNAHTGMGDPYLPFRDALAMLTGDVDSKWTGGWPTNNFARRLRELMPLTLPILVELGPDLINNFVPGPALATRAATFAPPEAHWFKQLIELTTAQPANLEQQRLFAQYTAILKAVARRLPILLILEDLHWLDFSSAALLFHLSREIEASRLLLVGTYRPDEVAAGHGEGQHPLAGISGELKRQFGNIWLDLGHLASAEGRRFVDSYLDTQPNRLSLAFRQALFKRTGGHPLFTVELLRDMAERGDLHRDENGHWVEGEAVNWQTLPARVEGVIETRIARLDKTQQALLTIASVEGETFTAEVVARAQRVSERDVVQQLSRQLDRQHRLVTAQTLEWLGQQRLSRYHFRHYLFQHYLYHSLDELERGYLHQEVGEAMETLYSAQTEQVALQLAWHFEQAGLIARAAGYLLQAGQQAARLSAHEEAMAHLRRGLALLENLPSSLNRTRQEIDLQLAVGNVLMTVKGYAAPEVEQAYTRARSLCRQVGDTPQFFPALYGLWVFHHVRAEHQAAAMVGEEWLRLARQQSDPAPLLMAHRVVGVSRLHLGELAAARHHLEECVRLYDAQKHHGLALSYGQDPGVAGHILLAWTLCLLDCPPDEVLRHRDEALALARHLAHPFSLAFALIHAAILHYLREENSAVQSYAEAAIAICSQHGFPFWLAAGRILHSWAVAEQAPTTATVADLRQSLQQAGKTTGASLWWPSFLTLMARVEATAGFAEKGTLLLDEALAKVRHTGEQWYSAELYRLKGEFLIGMEAEAMAEPYFNQAIAIARQQGACLWEQRAELGLSRLR